MIAPLQIESAYWCKYETPDGFDDLVIESDGKVITGIRFTCSYRELRRAARREKRSIRIFHDTCCWLDGYFNRQQPDFTPPYRLLGATFFRKEVLCEVQKIPFGNTMTYGAIAEKIAGLHEVGRMSAQAVGQAVGWNPICILIPCHRVLGAHGAIVGYGGGIHNKIALLKLESMQE